MTESTRKAHEAVWFEPLAAIVIFCLAIVLNQSIEWPWMWIMDLLACTGAALSFRRPVVGAILSGLSLAVWLPFEMTTVSASAMAFYVNVFAAARKDLSWKAPLVLGLAGLAYLALVRKAVEDPTYRWSTSIILLIVLVGAYGAGLAFRFATQRIASEKATGNKRVQDLQVSLARELHDSVAQTLSSAAMRANIVMGDPSLSPLAVDQLERIADECRSSAHDLRQLLSALRDDHERIMPPGPLADVESLRKAVETQADRLRDEGFQVTAKVDITKLSAARCQTLAAIMVEATNNVLKHAQSGTRCTFSIIQGSEDVLGEFSNVTNGGPHTPRQGFGLTGVQERLALLDGTCAVTRRGDRWILKVRLPLGLESNKSRPVSSPSPEELFARPTAP